ncbi:MAG: hypothetical protein P8J87_09340, partial [Verrucomicrobiales bacterium]|nr:hypothetical protein [Verrucomicrobiales bacterium]
MLARFSFLALALTLQLSSAQSPLESWSPNPLPSPPADGANPGFTWFRAYVNVPANWQGSRLLLVAGNIDTVDEAFFNGDKIGANGSMPPLFSKPASDIRRPFVIEPDQVNFGADNLIAWRVYSKDKPASVRNGPIHLSRKDDAIDLAGTWLKKSGDKP